MMEKQRSGPTKTRICLTLQVGPLVTGSEPLLCDGSVVGYVRRAETGKSMSSTQHFLKNNFVLGYSLNKTILYGYVEGNVNVNSSSHWQVLSRGQLWDGTLVRNSPYHQSKAKLYK